MINYLTIQDAIEHEIEIKKSRFICYLSPIQDENNFQEILSSIRKQHYKATHHCYAYILGQDHSIQRMSDDGEPSGTAGLPILEVLKQAELTYLSAIVVRYYGGTKLGSGGLIRAYSQATSQALNQLSIYQNIHQAILTATFDYAQLDRFNHHLDCFSHSLTVQDTLYTDKVILQLATYADQAASLKEELVNFFSGQVDLQDQGYRDVTLPYQNPLS